MSTLSISDRRRVMEITAVILTAAGKFFFMDYLNWRFPFIMAAIICWIGFIIYRVRIEKSILKYWGFRTDNFKTVARKVF